MDPYDPYFHMTQLHPIPSFGPFLVAMVTGRRVSLMATLLRRRVIQHSGRRYTREGGRQTFPDLSGHTRHDSVRDVASPIVLLASDSNYAGYGDREKLSTPTPGPTRSTNPPPPWLLFRSFDVEAVREAGQWSSPTRLSSISYCTTLKTTLV